MQVALRPNSAVTRISIEVNPDFLVLPWALVACATLTFICFRAFRKCCKRYEDSAFNTDSRITRNYNGVVWTCPENPGWRRLWQDHSTRNRVTVINPFQRDVDTTYVTHERQEI